MPRATKYTKAIADKIIEAIARGHNREDAARLAGIAPSTLYDWMAKKPEFSEACKNADSRAVDIGISALEKAAKGGSVRAIQLWLQSKRPGEWSPSQKVEIGNIDGQPFLSAGPDLGAISTADLMALLDIARKAAAEEASEANDTHNEQNPGSTPAG